MEQPKKDLATPEGQDALMGYLARCLDIISAELPSDLQPMIVLVHKTNPRTCTAIGRPTRKATISALKFLERNHRQTEVAANCTGVLIRATDKRQPGERAQ